MITTLLVANRGEIARRVFRTARAMGIRTAAVYSEPDRTSPHVREADVAVALTGATAAETYLNVDALLDAARRAGADAVHPGYGFLSENEAFARAVIDAGLTWVGPRPEHIATMGSKLEAKRLASDAGVPTLGSVTVGEGTDAAAVVDELGLPLLVKASAGGGGRGMRVVERAEDLADAIASAGREAAAAFGDGTLFCERYVRGGRHVEIQVFGDTHGDVVHLGERECSIQRRNQKVIEEAPSPGIDDALRMRMEAAAVSLAASIGYVGAGTVELLVDGDEFFFLEMNTRLQVEHPVTEEVWGVDLVRWQLVVADGGPLPATQDALAPRGHAVEARLYAEDPAAGWLPSPGTLHLYREGDAAAGTRFEHGVAEGDEISPHYDPMVAKVVRWAPTRPEALAGLARTLAGMGVAGVATNRDTLVATLRHPEVAAGNTTTRFFDDHPEVVTAGAGADAEALAAVAATLDRERANRAGDRHWGFAPSGWRTVPTGRRSVTWDLPGERALTVEYLMGAAGWFEATVLDGTSGPDDADAGPRDLSGRVLAHTDEPDGGRRLTVEVDEVSRSVTVHAEGDGPGRRRWCHGADGQVELVERSRFPIHAADMVGGGPTAPVPGTITSVAVAPGDEVADGQVLVVMEAMKMEHRIVAPEAARVTEVLVAEGEQVSANAVLVHLEPLT
ncbi:MAG: biotin carboxylase N-terminal domain-containing protein [Actinomycetota bacterium]|nr:biotin carboxylase N-terminal domain-containing protein [Actinomycetota bacterium]